MSARARSLSLTSCDLELWPHARKVQRFMPWSCRPLVPICTKIIFTRFQNKLNFGNGRTDQSQINNQTARLKTVRLRAPAVWHRPNNTNIQNSTCREFFMFCSRNSGWIRGTSGSLAPCRISVGQHIAFVSLRQMSPTEPFNQINITMIIIETLCTVQNVSN